MSPLLIKISKDFATLFTTLNPIATLALFAGLTASLSRADRHWTALRACIYATIILVVAMTAGQVILDAIGIHMHSLKVAGGIILFLFGSQMLFGKMDEKPGSSPEEGRDLAVEDVNHCVFPLLQTVTCLSIRVSPSLAKVS